MKKNKCKKEVKLVPAPAPSAPIEGYDPHQASIEYTAYLQSREQEFRNVRKFMDEAPSRHRKRLEELANTEINPDVLLPAPAPSGPIEGYDRKQASIEYTMNYNRIKIAERDRAREELAKMDGKKGVSPKSKAR